MLGIPEPILWTALALLTVYCAQTLRRWKWKRLEQYADFPQLDKPSLLWGHLKVLNRLFKKGDRRRHIDMVLTEAYREQGSPPVMLLDLRPLEYPILVISNYEVAEQISKSSSRWPSSTPKSPTLANIWHLTGKDSILTAEGDHWKQQRRRLNPGFAPQQLLTTLPIILDKTRYFLAHLDRYASSGDEFSLDQLATNLTFDIIGAVTMGQDLKAQIPGEEDELLVAYMGIGAQFRGRSGIDIPGANWRRERIRRRLAAKVERLMNDIVRKDSNSISNNHSSGGDSRSVLALSLQGMDELTPELLQQTSDNLRVFMFAGHDTTSILMQWALYELSRSPKQRRALKAELDEVFGPDADPDAVRAKLLAPGGGELLGQMPYTAAVIKETLRLHPPAASARMSPPGSNFQLTLPDGRQVCPDGTVLYLNSHIIQRDHAVWGEAADDFWPERWLGEDSRSVPAGAWRPFERGPRSCIGLELANIEAKVILALVARRYDFVKVGIGELHLDGEGHPVVDEKGYYKTKSELFNSIQVTAKPVDGTMCKVRLSSEASES
ncbi:hypothetical protein M406DRAFT_79478 [Cryphonectria parasitica EP155]|uniref:Cytochrome P450 n=1 Tax=Cryphonectria parasitica (strain ATCC 38755 / EP155) TaxID=660469 RepID=A0A9P5CR64_CRYP1|nr:uncharacterized protein M406DRAFT_79478 [Cryphonectria parasitica EP155]KAF3766941.1 hypothetical protein M406DRAFT_79478 [Cryphonectria parasitica EP155]